ncbi:hypothetical protein VTN31DRAFT_657 [Thermomyces dupontii]|uniref:uncharacterized protein n=1 Tax=Talaromyces thermophilus TaxID=28565 RepID=UPI00374483CD
MSSGSDTKNDADNPPRQKPSGFRSSISREPGTEFPPEKGRYYLYLSLSCPFAHRTNIVRTLKGLESIVELVILDHDLGPDGWFFSGRDGRAEKDPLYGFTHLRDLYLKADPNYTGRYTVPVLWDRKKETIVNNESAEIMRMFFTEFDDLLPPERRESAHPLGGYYPPPSHPLRAEVDTMIVWMNDQLNTGVYKAGLAETQAAYDENVVRVFEALDRVEAHLASPDHQPYLFGKHITEADIRLFPTFVRFDVAYFAVFRCNLRMIRYEYPNIHKWLRRLYWDESETTHGAFKKTSALSIYKRLYTIPYLRNHGFQGEIIIPAGPLPEMLPLDENDR